MVHLTYIRFVWILNHSDKINFNEKEEVTAIKLSTFRFLLNFLPLYSFPCDVLMTYCELKKYT